MNTIVVVVHWGSSKMTRHTVTSLLRAGLRSDRITVVENGMKWESCEATDTVRRIFLSRNLGYAGGANAGMADAFARGADAALVLNNDLSFPIGALESMEHELLQSVTTGCVGAVMDEGDGCLVYGGGRISWLTGRAHLQCSPVARSKLHYISGACMLIRRKAFEEAGFIPEYYFHTWEDAAWGAMLRAKKWDIAWAKTPVISHPRSQSLPDGPDKTYYLVRNGALFVRNHAPYYARMWLLFLEPLRIMYAQMRRKYDVIRALRDARNNVRGAVIKPQTTYNASDPGNNNIPARLDRCGKSQMHVDISIIIPTHQSSATILQCLQSARSALNVFNGKGELIVVDAGSTDGTVDIVQTSGLADHVHRYGNIGFGAIANRGAKHAGGSMFFFLNPDAEIPPDALERIVMAFQRNNVGILGCALVSRAGRLEHMQNTPFPTLGRTIFGYGMRHQAKCITDSKPFSVPWVSGGAMAIRADAFRELQGFTESYFLYFEDVDLCMRSRKKGWNIIFHPSIRVVHERGKSTSHPRRKALYDHAQNLYFSMYRPRWEYIMLRILRPMYRNAWVAILGIGSASIAVSPVIALVCALAVALFAATVRSPYVGVFVLAGSLIAGQVGRIPIGGYSVTATDVMLPLVLTGFFLAALKRGVGYDLVRRIWSGWWIVAALLPGILLAVERLPIDDVLVALMYAIRFGLALLLIAAVQSLQLSFRMVRASLFAATAFLAIAGLMQLRFYPSLSPDVFGGGWDPHQFRLFSTWLDPNFIGGLFAMMIALSLPDLFSRVSRSHHAVLRHATPLAVLVLLFAVSLILTESRAAAIALVVVIGLFGAAMASTRIRSRLQPRFLIPLAGCIVLAILIAPGLALRFIPSPEGDPTLALRFESWNQAVGHVEQYPWFGLGYNAYGAEQVISGNVSDAEIHSVAAADNAVLTFMATTGLWGMLLIIGGIVRFVRTMIIQSKYHAPAFAALLAFATLAIHTQFMQSITYIHLLVPLALVLGSVGKAPVAESSVAEQST